MGILTETPMCEDMILCTDLACCHVVDEIATESLFCIATVTIQL